MLLGRPPMSTRTGIWSFGVATRSRSSGAPPALPKCKRRRRCWKRSSKVRLGVQYASVIAGLDPAIHPLRLKCLFPMDARVKPGHDAIGSLLLERPVGDDGRALNAAEPPERDIVALARQR